jgi:enoyl-CoA hydratase
MLHVALQQIRRARGMTLEQVLRMERDLVRHCFAPHHLGKTGVNSETLEGIRALAIDKDHHPRWNPSTVEEVKPDMVEPFFNSPWPAQAHPLASLG